ncbi:MAG: hypothetical protein AB1801_00215 [Chloroflexota bacterium]
MTRRRVLLLGQPSIFTNGVQKILEQQAEGVELVGVALLEAGKVDIVGRFQPDVVVLAGGDDAPPLIEICLARLLKTYPDLSVIVANATENTLYIYTSQRLAACSSDLLVAISAVPKHR